MLQYTRAYCFCRGDSVVYPHARGSLAANASFDCRLQEDDRFHSLAHLFDSSSSILTVEVEDRLAPRCMALVEDALQTPCLHHEERRKLLEFHIHLRIIAFASSGQRQKRRNLRQVLARMYWLRLVTLIGWVLAAAAWLSVVSMLLWV